MNGQPRELLEREAELISLEQAIAEAAGGEGRLVLIAGPPGIGKTRLVGVAKERAQAAGLLVLSARGGEIEQEFAYGVVRQLFEPFLAGREPEERAALLSAAAAPAGRLFGAEGEEDSAEFSILHGLYWLTANVAARGPLFLGVDDLHWCDRPSIRFLSFLARRLEGLPVVVAAALRPDEASADAALLDALAHDAATRPVRPRALSEDATAALVRRELPGADREVCAACHVATGGNPLLVIELTRALEAAGIEPVARNAGAVLEIGPEAVVRAVRARLGQLPQEAGALARAAAVLGDGAGVADAGRLAQLDEPAAFAAAAALGRARILRPRDVVEFVHPVERAAIYASLGVDEQWTAHARAAQLLLASGSAPEQVAAHILAGPPRQDPRAVEILRSAARQSLARGAADVAADYLRRALDEPPPGPEVVDVLLELGGAELAVDGASAALHLRAALELQDGSPSRSRTSLALGIALYFSGELADAAEVLETALAEPGLEAEVAAQLDGMLLVIGVFNARWSERARRRLDWFDPNTATDGTGDRVRLAMSAYHDARDGAPQTQVVERARRVVPGVVRIGDIQGLAHISAAEVLMAADLLDEAEVAVTAVADAGHAAGSLFRVAVGTCFRSHVHLLRGALAQAVADAWTAIEAAELHGHVPALHWSYGFLLQALIERGELAEAEAVLARGGLGGALVEQSRLHGVQLARGRLKLERGSAREGVEDLLDLGRRYAAFGGSNPALLEWRSTAALGLHALGEVERARTLAAEEAALARAWGGQRALAQALRVEGLVRGGEEGLALLREAAETAARSPARLERARSAIELGAALRRSNQRAEARALLRDGLDLAHACGARPLQERALAELVATGARPRRVSISGRDSLTPSELRVAELVAEGHTNREIAQRLFITQKTVETHLRNVFRKLGLESRAQLALALERDVQAA